MNAEIDFLIGSVGEHGCSFIRNGKRFSARDARAYLQSKRRHNAGIIHSTEEFIEKIASESVTTGKPYVIHCKGKPRENAGDWFRALLAEHRRNSSSASMP